MLEIKHQPCLILNQDYRPLLVVSWKRALCLDIIGKEMPGEGIRVISYYDDDYVISAGGDPFPLPAVAVSNRYVKRRRKIALKKRNLLIRDNRSCQYCGEGVQPGKSTIDHVVPKSHFDDPVEAHTWNNTVIACWRCNSSKGNRTPKQANMRLLAVPKEPESGSFYVGLSPWQSMPEEWKDFVKV
jgi:hypothetical protein